MKTIIIMLHNKLNQAILANQLKKLAQAQSTQEPLQIIAITLPEPKQSQVTSITKLKAELKGKVNPEDVYAFIIESNYGFPSEELVDFDMLQYGLHSFPHARIIAYSSTLNSLAMAAKVDDSISVCHSTSTQVDAIIAAFNQCQALAKQDIDKINDRVFTRALDKELASLMISENSENIELTINKAIPITFAADNPINSTLAPTKTDDHSPATSLIGKKIHQSP